MPRPRSSQCLTLWIKHSSVVSTVWIRWNPTFMNLPIFWKPVTKCQTGISTLRCLQSHFDGDWISKRLESEGTAYGHWPVSSQLVGSQQNLTSADYQGVGPQWSSSDISLKPLICLCPFESSSCILSSWDTYCSCIFLLLWADRYTDCWFLDNLTKVI